MCQDGGNELTCDCGMTSYGGEKCHECELFIYFSFYPSLGVSGHQGYTEIGKIESYLSLHESQEVNAGYLRHIVNLYQPKITCRILKQLHSEVFIRYIGLLFQEEVLDIW